MRDIAAKLLKAGAVFLSTAICSTAITAVAQAAASRNDPLPRYTVTDLGTLGGTLSFATGINDEGWVDGFSNLNGDVEQRAFLWRGASCRTSAPWEARTAASVSGGKDQIGGARLQAPESPRHSIRITRRSAASSIVLLRARDPV
jgi:hypothetical protein